MLRIRTFACFALAYLLILPPLSAQEKKETKDEEKATLAQEKSWDEVEANRRFEYALSLHRERKLREAIRTYREALDLYPTFTEARLNLAGALLDSRKLDQAEALLDRLEETHPEDSRVLFNKALLLSLRGKVHDALEILTRIRKQEDAALKIYLLEASLFQKVRNWRKAEKVLTAAIHAFPTRFGAHYEYARFLDGRNRGTEAIGAYSKALQHLPKQIDTKSNPYKRIARLTRMRIRTLQDRREEPQGPNPTEPRGVKGVFDEE